MVPSQYGDGDLARRRIGLAPEGDSLRNHSKRRLAGLLPSFGVASILFVSGPGSSEPFEVTGVILGSADRTAAVSQLGVGPISASTDVIGFDLTEAIAALCDDPNSFEIEDDAIPESGPDNSGGPFTGVDVDAVAARNSVGSSIFSTDVLMSLFGPKISPAPNTSGACLDPVVDGLFGDTEPEGFPENVLGPPDAGVQFGCDPAGFSRFTSIGSGGILNLVFGEPIADSNLVAGFDLFLFDAGGAGDNAIFRVDVVPGIIDLAPRLDFNAPDTEHTHTLSLTNTAGDVVPDVEVIFDVFSGPNSGDSAVAMTNVYGEASFTYLGDGGIGVDEIVASFVDPQCGVVDSNVALKFWDTDCQPNGIPDTCDLDCSAFSGDCESFEGCGASLDGDGNGLPDECNTPPVAACVESTNPAGKRVPRAGRTTPRGPKGGQNEDGFYKLVGEDLQDGAVGVFVTNAGGFPIFGPFPSDSVVKITEAPGATPTSRPIGGPSSAVAAHIKLDSDAFVFAVDSFGEASPMVSCLVPPLPK
jgi:hypothetical protein